MPSSSFSDRALPVPIVHPAPAAVFLFVIVKLLLAGSKFLTWTRSASFRDCVTLPGLGTLVAASAAALAVRLPPTASCRDSGVSESDELQADRTKGRAIAAANDAAPVSRVNMVRLPCFDW